MCDAFYSLHVVYIHMYLGTSSASRLYQKEEEENAKVNILSIILFRIIDYRIMFIILFLFSLHIIRSMYLWFM